MILHNVAEHKAKTNAIDVGTQTHNQNIVKLKTTSFIITS